jgi:phenylacetate-CoA ligase
MTMEHFDARETIDPAAREADFAQRLPTLVQAALATPGWRAHLGDIDPRSINSRAALAKLPVLRKSRLIEQQRQEPPFAGFVAGPRDAFGRMFTSPGPIYEPEGRHDDPWRTARGLFAAGFRRGDVVQNTFSYHLTPGGFIFDSGARAVGCVVIPAGPGNADAQLDVIAHLQPVGYAGTPDFLKILLDAGEVKGKPLKSIKRAAMSGAAFPPSLQAEIKARGIDAYQLYATSDLGCVAYETAARDGLVLSEDVLLEIVRPGTGDPVAGGEVGEIVVTSFDHDHPWIRLALGDLSATLPGASATGHTNTRIKGWMGRADQSTKVKGMFVHPEQVAAIARLHPELQKLRLVVSRRGEVDTMTLLAESASREPALTAAIGESLRAQTKLGGTIELVQPGSLPNDGKVIEDARPV